MAQNDLKLLWGANSSLPATKTNGKAYFAVRDDAYPDVAPDDEAYIYFDKDGERYNVIAKRAIFDALGNKITEAYLASLSDDGVNNITFHSTGKNDLTAFQIVKTNDLSQAQTSTKQTITSSVNTIQGSVELGHATEELVGIVSTGSQNFGGDKTFYGAVTVGRSDTKKSLTLYGDFDATGATAAFNMSGNVNITSGNELDLSATNLIALTTKTVTVTSDEANILGSVNLNSTNSGTTTINGATTIKKATTIEGQTSIKNDLIVGTSSANRAVTIHGTITGSGVVTLNSTNNATKGDAKSGALRVAGGASIANAVWIGGLLNVAGATTLQGTLNGNGNVVLNASESSTANYKTTIKGIAQFDKAITAYADFNTSGRIVVTNTEVAAPATSTTSMTGSIQTAGGIITSSNLYVGSDTQGTNSAGAIYTKGGAHIDKQLYVAGVTTVANSTETSSASDGALMVSGGANIAKRLRVRGNHNSTSTDSGSIVVTGGVGVSGNIYAGGVIRITGTTNVSTTLATKQGAIISDGGLYVTKNIVVYGNTSSGSTTTGSIVTRGGIGLGGNIYAGGNAVVGGYGSFGGDVYAKGGEVYIGPDNGRATLSYDGSTDTLTISFT